MGNNQSVTSSLVELSYCTNGISCASLLYLAAGSSSNKTPKYEMNLVNEKYETRMIGCKASCADGTGDPTACHHVGGVS